MCVCRFCVGFCGNLASTEVNGDIEEINCRGGDFLSEIDVAVWCAYVVDKNVRNI